MSPCSDLGPVPPSAHVNGISSKLLQRRSTISRASSSCGIARCFLVALAFAALGLVLNFLFLLRLEERRTILSVSRPSRQGKLAVVVPAHRGDLDRALASLSRWPTACSPVTLSSVDLILYYAAAPDDKSVRILPSLSWTGGRCFAHTQVVYANLTDEVRGFCTKGCVR